VPRRPAPDAVDDLLHPSERMRSGGCRRRALGPPPAESSGRLVPGYCLSCGTVTVVVQVVSLRASSRPT
jgi:hypothetical protein